MLFSMEILFLPCKPAIHHQVIPHLTLRRRRRSRLEFYQSWSRSDHGFFLSKFLKANQKVELPIFPRLLLPAQKHLHHSLFNSYQQENGNSWDRFSPSLLPRSLQFQQVIILSHKLSFRTHDSQWCGCRRDETIFLQLQNPSDDWDTWNSKNDHPQLKTMILLRFRHMFSMVLWQKIRRITGFYKFCSIRKKRNQQSFCHSLWCQWNRYCTGQICSPLSGEVSIASGEQEALVTIDTTGFDDNEMEGSKPSPLPFTSSSSSLATLSVNAEKLCRADTDDEDADGDGSDSSVEDSANNNGDGNGTEFPIVNNRTSPTSSNRKFFHGGIGWNLFRGEQCGGMSESDLPMIPNISIRRVPSPHPVW